MFSNCKDDQVEVYIIIAHALLKGERREKKTEPVSMMHVFRKCSNYWSCMSVPFFWPRVSWLLLSSLVIPVISMVSYSDFFLLKLFYLFFSWLNCFHNYKYFYLGKYILIPATLSSHYYSLYPLSLPIANCLLKV